MKMTRTTTNQWALGIGYRHSQLFGGTTHLIYINYGYRYVYWAWGNNPVDPRTK